MKILCSILILLACSVAGMAQIDEPWIETMADPDIHNGGYIGPTAKFGEIKDEFALLVGGQGGWIFNHTLMFGGGGYFLVNEIDAGFEDQDVLYRMSYGGMILEYIHKSHKLIHYTSGVLIGGGVFGFTENNERRVDMDSDTFFILEPRVDVIINVTPEFRVALGISYMSINGVDELDGISDSDLNRVAGNLTFKLGNF
jgi:hypothetical protein